MSGRRAICGECGGCGVYVIGCRLTSNQHIAGRVNEAPGTLHNNKCEVTVSYRSIGIGAFPARSLCHSQNASSRCYNELVIV